MRPRAGGIFLGGARGPPATWGKFTVADCIMHHLAHTRGKIFAIAKAETSLSASTNKSETSKKMFGVRSRVQQKTHTKMQSQ